MSQRFFLIAAWFLLAGQFFAMAAAFDQPDFPNIIRVYGDQLAAVTSQPQAKSLFVTHLAQALDLKDTFSTSAGKGAHHPSVSAADQNSASPDPDTLAIRLTADLATWRLAAAMKHATDAGEPGEIRTVLDQTEPQRNWLLGENESPLVRRAVNLASVLSSFSAVESRSAEPLAHYAEYAGYLDHTYPRFTGSDDSWLATAEQEGINGIRRRLASFWNQTDPPGSPGLKTEDDGQEILEAHYFQLRLRPVLTAHLVALTIRAEATAEQRVRDEWLSLRTWQEKQKELKGFARLCGTWQWTVHNHQNHQDHKMMMVFPSSDRNSPALARPAKITVLGDGVYLRWEFPGGYQEDSLLFTGEGQRLEGSFTNSTGAWGSITGKRIAACGK